MATEPYRLQIKWGSKKKNRNCTLHKPLQPVSVSLYVAPLSVARQRLGKNVTAAYIFGHMCLWVCLCIPAVDARRQISRGNEELWKV
jgi:hypothetical protein